MSVLTFELAPIEGRAAAIGEVGPNTLPVKNDQSGAEFHPQRQRSWAVTGAAVFAAVTGAPISSSWQLRCTNVEGVTGWAIGASRMRPLDQPVDAAADAASLYDTLERTVIPLFHRRQNEFIDVTRYAIALNGSFFTAQRMLQEYLIKALQLRAARRRGATLRPWCAGCGPSRSRSRYRLRVPDLPGKDHREIPPSIGNFTLEHQPAVRDPMAWQAPETGIPRANRGEHGNTVAHASAFDVPLNGRRSCPPSRESSFGSISATHQRRRCSNPHACSPTPSACKNQLRSPWQHGRHDRCLTGHD